MQAWELELIKKQVEELLQQQSPLSRSAVPIGSSLVDRTRDVQVSALCETVLKLIAENLALQRGVDFVKGVAEARQMLDASVSWCAKHVIVDEPGCPGCKIDELEAENESLRAFKRSVDEALNHGDGSYRP